MIAPWKSRRSALAAVLALFAVLAVTGPASASAEKIPVWTSGGTPLKFGSEVNFSGESNGGMNLRWTNSGVPYWIQCSTLSASGKVENYASGKAGSASYLAGAFKGCVLVQAGTYFFGGEPTTCQLPSEIPVEFTASQLSNSPYPGGGLPLEFRNTETWIKNCAAGARVQLFGTAVAREGQGQAPGEVEVPAAAQNIRVGLVNAEIEFSMKVRGAGDVPLVIGQDEVSYPSTPGHYYWYTGGNQRRGEGPRKLVAAGSPLAITGGTNTLTIETTVGGLPTLITCSGSGKTSGSVENPSGGANGIANASITFTGCTVPKPENFNCTIPNGEIVLGPMSGALAATAPYPLLLFTAPAETLSNISFTGCKVGSFNINHPLKGTLPVNPYASLGARWLIPKDLNNSYQLRFYGQKATVSGEVTVEHEGSAVSLH